MKRKKILILFPLEHIAFSPTVLGIYDALSKEADVTVYCPQPRDFKVADNGGRNIIYFNYNTRRIRKLKAVPLYLFSKVKKIITGNKKSTNLNLSNSISTLGIYDFVRYLEYKKAISSLKNNYDEVIAVDILFLAVAQSFCKTASFLSLELNDGEIGLLKSIPCAFIKCVIIQTKERYNYLFGEKSLRTFYIQNAPVFSDLPQVNKIPKALLFNGTATPWFGLFHSLNFIKAYPGFSLTFKGVVLESEKEKIKTDYSELIKAGNIVFNKEYTDSRNMLQFMSAYEMGFCFYDRSFPKMNTFNYQTAPSGKMFAYFAAGVPVIGNDLEGLRIIEKFGAGLLIKDFRPETIFDAVSKIKSNYDFYRQNCLKAAAHYSFDRNVAPFTAFLIGNTSDDFID